MKLMIKTCFFFPNFCEGVIFLGFNINKIDSALSLISRVHAMVANDITKKENNITSACM